MTMKLNSMLNVDKIDITDFTKVIFTIIVQNNRGIIFFMVY